MSAVSWMMPCAQQTALSANHSKEMTPSQDLAAMIHVTEPLPQASELLLTPKVVECWVAQGQC